MRIGTRPSGHVFFDVIRFGRTELASVSRVYIFRVGAKHPFYMKLQLPKTLVDEKKKLTYVYLYIQIMTKYETYIYFTE